MPVGQAWLKSEAVNVIGPGGDELKSAENDPCWMRESAHGEITFHVGR